MTTNAFQLHDDLLPYVHSVTLVHPPHVALITRAQVTTDKIAASILARLHAVGLLPPVWVPPLEIRDQRALVTHRAKMVRLSTQAKNRLHAVLHRHHLLPPEGDLFASDKQEWWLNLNLTPIQRVRIQSDLDTLTFAQSQIALLEETLTVLAAQDERVLLLIQLPGIGLITAMTLLAAIGVSSSRFIFQAAPHAQPESLDGNDLNLLTLGDGAVVGHCSPHLSCHPHRPVGVERRPDDTPATNQ